MSWGGDMYQTMSITSAGPCLLADQKPLQKPYVIKQINKLSDIEGAQSNVPYSQKYSNKPQFNTADVPGSTSRSLTHSRNVRDMSLYIDDIDGTRHSIKDRMMRTKRHVNPLVPDYNLASFAPAEIPETKFLRNTLYNDDVDGAKTKPGKETTIATRDNISTDDIVGAQASWRPRHRKARLESAPHDIMGISSDIVLRKSRFQDRCVRNTNLCDPAYFVNGMTVQDDATHSKPKPLKVFIPGNHLLQTHDIDGAVPGWGRLKRREVRNIMTTQDIEGAQADSIKHSIQTMRTSNPLTPVYQSLDGGEAMPPLITPLMPARMVTVATLRPKTTSTLEKERSSSALLEATSTANGGAASYANKFADTDNFRMHDDEPPRVSFSATDFFDSAQNNVHTVPHKPPLAMSNKQLQLKLKLNNLDDKQQGSANLSDRGGGSSGGRPAMKLVNSASPVTSARRNSRAEAERQSEIEAVRNL